MQGKTVVATGATFGVGVDFSDLQGARGYNGWRAYGRSKLANILFSARRRDG